MPNWCHQTVEFYSEDAEKIRALKLAIQSENLLKTYYPVPEGLTDDEEDQWRIEKWNTKWDICDAEITYSNENAISIKFLTAWAPPTPVFEKIEQLGIEVLAHYFCEGDGSGGTYEKGEDTWYEAPLPEYLRNEFCLSDDEEEEEEEE